MTSTLLRCRGVLFDFDGVLVDSHGISERAWLTWAEEFSLDPQQVLAGLRGRRSRDTVAVFLAEDLRAEGLRRVDELELGDVDGVRFIPGASQLLANPPDHWAIVTSCTRGLLAARMAAAGVPSPPVVVTGDDIEHGKPAPDGYLRAAELLGLPIGDCVVVEDAPAGIQAARRAGAGHVLGVGPAAAAADPTLVVDDLRTVRWAGDGLLVSAPEAEVR